MQFLISHFHFHFLFDFAFVQFLCHGNVNVYTIGESRNTIQDENAF